MVTLSTSPRARRGGGYGQTEVCGLVTWQALGESMGQAGRAHPFSQVRIIDDEGNEQPVGVVGEIAVRGPVVMVGYHNRPELNAKQMAGGWRRTSDLGRREPDGSMTFIGPKFKMIKSGQENIYPAEVEAAIAKHPDVEKCAVIGVPDDKWIQTVKAIVVVREDAKLDADQVIDHCRSLIASYKRPHHVELVDELPLKNGLVDYDALDAAFGGGAYPGLGTKSR